MTSGLVHPTGIDIDVAGEKIYWADEANSIKRANLDGSGVETILTSGGRAIEFDPVGSNIYWSNRR